MPKASQIKIETGSNNEPVFSSFEEEIEVYIKNLDGVFIPIIQDFGIATEFKFKIFRNVKYIYNKWGWVLGEDMIIFGYNPNTCHAGIQIKPPVEKLSLTDSSECPYNRPQRCTNCGKCSKL